MKKFSEHIKTLNESIKNRLNFLCIEYDTKLKELDMGYKKRFIEMITMILSNFKEYSSDLSDDGIDLYEFDIDSIRIGTITKKLYVYRLEYQASGDWVACITEEGLDGSVHEYELSDLPTSDLSIILNAILKSNELIRYFGSSAIVKMNQ